MASQDKIFLDTDVALDHLADRQPFAEYAHRIFALAETGQVTICLSSLSFSNLYHILRKPKGHDETLALLRKLKLLARVSAVTEAETAHFNPARNGSPTSRASTRPRSAA